AGGKGRMQLRELVAALLEFAVLVEVERELVLVRDELLLLGDERVVRRRDGSDGLRGSGRLAFDDARADALEARADRGADRQADPELAISEPCQRRHATPRRSCG